jgi:hypothetical protein
VKPQRVRYKLGETIEQPCSDVLAHTLEVCKGTHLYNRYSTIQDGHNIWGMCTTSAECKTVFSAKCKIVLIAMLTVMSSMDPRMIRWLLLLVRFVLHSGLYGVIDVPRLKHWSLLRDLEAFVIVITTAFCESNLVKTFLA